MATASELNYNTNASAMQMADTIFGDGTTVISASYTGDNRSSGIYTEGDTVSSGVTPADTGVILSTGRADDFTNSAGTLPWWQGGGPTQANQDNNTSTNTSGFNNNAQFNAAAGTNTYDGAMLSVNFIPTGDVMTMQFVFSSEEFPEYANSQYQDFVGVWVNGQQVEMAVGAANPGNLVGGINQNLYNDNTGSQYNTEMDGFTVTMTLTFPVTAGIVNSIQIGIADVGDSSYDSNLLIAGDSLQTVLIATDDILHLPAGDTKTIDVLANDFAASGGVMVITEINGQAVSAGDTITLATGQTVTLNADGTITVVSDGDDEYFNFTYSISDGVHTDTGFVLVDNVPCFTAGTMIAGSILLGRALAPVENAIDAWKQLSMARSAHDNLRTFFEEHAQKAEKTRLDIPPPKGNLSVEGLVYAYPGTNHAIIRGLNLEILAGEVVAIIGPSGAGKSTLARLLIGVLRPNAGSVRIDQIDIRNWERERLGPYVGYLPQDVELFRGTIAENIGRFTKLDSDAVVEAAKLSGVHDMIAALPDAYDTELGERGLGLSGGERQRVGLARAMYGHPVLLVLDEPNSNLDAESEERLLAVIRYMKSQGCTIVFIAHRPTMLQSADRIILMRQGRIEAMGPRDEILKRLVKPPAGPQPPSPPAIGNK